jgi:hypothetical protein
MGSFTRVGLHMEAIRISDFGLGFMFQMLCGIYELGVGRI